MHSENLFTNYTQIENNAPLADQLRPKNLEDFYYSLFPSLLLTSKLG